MLVITLPDGSRREFDHAVTVMDVAQSIGAGLAKATLAGRVNNILVDASTLISEDASLQIITSKDEEGVDVIRHSTAHLLAQAVKQLFPEAQVTIGPVIENGFYYDFSYHRAFTPEDLTAIEAKMQQLASADYVINRSVVSRDAAVKFFKDLGENYKAELIESIPSNEDLSLYEQGGFTDLCRGPHVPSTGKLTSFKLMKIAGAYWRGNSDNEMLQRIYGTAWTDKKELQAYLHRLEEAEKRDHRKLAKTFDLFHMQEEAPGMIFWHDKGWVIYQQIEQFIREKLRVNGYGEVKTPQLVDRSLWEKSGHWDKFGAMIFTTHSESRDYAVKPMNCPCHVQIFNQGMKSYRDLPLRMAEFGSCHRSEPSGALHGLMRVRGFTQDDAHIFCTKEQIQTEVRQILDLVQSIYADFGFDTITYRLARRPESRVGSDEIWDNAEQALQNAMDAKQITWIDAPGEGAFYGPKIECSLADCLGRIWQCGTIQIDFSTPNRLGALYVAEDGSKQHPVMIHRAILGSFERFIGILIEHFAGHFPLWLAPTQVVVLTISEKHNEHATKVQKSLQNAGIRAGIDLRNEKIGFKIREHTLLKVPYMLIIGDKEVDQNQATWRTRAGVDLGMVTIESVCDRMRQEILSKSININGGLSY